MIFSQKRKQKVRACHLRLAYVGCGNISSYHLSALKQARFNLTTWPSSSDSSPFLCWQAITKLSGKVRVTIAAIVDPSATARTKMAKAIQKTLNTNEGMMLEYRQCSQMQNTRARGHLRIHTYHCSNRVCI